MYNTLKVSAVILLAGILSPLFGTVTEDRSKDVMFPIQYAAEEKPTQDSLCQTSYLTVYQKGLASWYGPGFQGKKMANGRPFDMERYTVAHRTLPLGTEVCITNEESGKSLKAVVTDRGPYVFPRAIDVSKRIASELNFKEKGIGRVTISIRVTR